MTGPFNSQIDCLFCGTTITHGSKDTSSVKTDTLAESILECCDNRADQWACTVKGRIDYYDHDLDVVDCVYHHLCSSSFRNGCNVLIHSRKTQRKSTESLAGPKIKIRSRHSWKFDLTSKVMDSWQLHILEKKWVLNQIPLPKGLLPDHGVDWKGRWHEHSGLGIETGGQPVTASYD